jgi:hypothetical protein
MPNQYRFFSPREFDVPELEEYFFVPREGESGVQRFVIPKDSWHTWSWSDEEGRFNDAMKRYHGILRYLGEDDDDEVAEKGGAREDRLEERLEALEEMLERLTKRIEEKIKEQRD